MAYFDTSWYVHAGDGSTTGYYAVPKWSAGATTTVGALRRQLAAPAVNSERVFVCILNGVTGASEPTWVITRGAKTTDNTVTWMECTGQAGVNGDVTNTPNWTSGSLGSKAISLGVIIANTAKTYLFICTIAGTNSSGEPPWVLGAGNVTAAGGATYMCIGAVGAFAPFAAPFPRIIPSYAVNWGVAGNDFYIADNSAESALVAITIAFGSSAAPSRAFSVDHTVMPPVQKAGASITCTASAAFLVSTGGGTYWYGVTFIANCSVTGGALQMTGNATYMRYDNCSFQLGPGAVAGSQILVGPGSQFEGSSDFNNCTFSFSNVGQALLWTGGWHWWRNTPDPCFLGTIPTNPMRAFANASAQILFEGIDFTSAGANTLWNGAFSGVFATFKNCKMHSGPVVGAITLPAAVVLNLDLVNSDVAGVIRNERHNYYGDEYTSFNGGSGNFSVYRTGGAVDGGVGIAHYIVPETTVRYWRPFNCIPLTIWNDVVGSPVTVTIYGAAPFTLVLPTPDRAWFELEYMGDSGSPIAFWARSAAPVADAVSVWPNITATHTNFSMSVTVTPQQKGYLTIYPKINDSLTYYLDPKPVLS